MNGHNGDLGCKSTLKILVLCLLAVLLLMGTCVAFGVTQWNKHVAENKAAEDAIAPIVLSTPAKQCALSTAATYMAAWHPGRSTASFYKLESWSAQPVAFAGSLPDSPHPGVWLSDTSWFQSKTPFGKPAEDGWILDMAAGSITDLHTLPEPERSALLKQARSLTATETQRRDLGEVSPDQRYIVSRGIIYTYKASWENRTGKLVASFPADTQECLSGWKADSSGVYIIEYRRSPGLSRSPPSEPGPIRFLPVVPTK
jgi:hypothetical protein